VCPVGGPVPGRHMDYFVCRVIVAPPRVFFFFSNLTRTPATAIIAANITIKNISKVIVKTGSNRLGF
ncbi:hypothetical protein, partial [Enterobacter intestinihominis]